MVDASQAAAALGRARWAKVPKSERSAAMSELAKRAADSMTPAERKARATKASKAAAVARKKAKRRK